MTDKLDIHPIIGLAALRNTPIRLFSLFPALDAAQLFGRTMVLHKP